MTWDTIEARPLLIDVGVLVVGSPRGICEATSGKIRRAAMAVGFVIGSLTEISTLGLCFILPHELPLRWSVVLAWALISSLLCIFVMQALFSLSGKRRGGDELDPLEIAFVCSHVIISCVMRTVVSLYFVGLKECLVLNYLASCVYVSIGVYGLKKSWTLVENECEINQNLNDNASTV